MMKFSFVALPLALSLVTVSPGTAQAVETPVGETYTLQQSSEYALSTKDFFSEKTSAESNYIEAASPAEAVAKMNMMDELRQAGFNVGTMAKVNYGPCKIVAEGFHTRKSGKYETGGFKSTTYCTKKVTAIHHSSQARFKRLAWWVKGGRAIGQPAQKMKAGKHNGTYYPTVFQQTNHALTCKSAKTTTWSGRTLGTIVYNGKTYYADAYAPVQKGVRCRL
ncbi:hypothetical protein [Glutamicibacter sp. NPDC087673]|uniref:hypothetical protein n=1 Tax=Glutamicibacter sp. NPDC087673 TaxID=3363997 RepID=UPI0037FC40F0